MSTLYQTPPAPIAIGKQLDAVVLASRPQCRLPPSDYGRLVLGWYGDDSPHLNRVGLPHGEQARLVKTVKVCSTMRRGCGSDRRFPPGVTWDALRGSVKQPTDGALWAVGCVSAGDRYRLGHRSVVLRDVLMYNQAYVSWLARKAPASIATGQRRPMKSGKPRIMWVATGNRTRGLRLESGAD